MRDRDGQPCRGPTRLLEKTPKNALRIPFLAQAFPDARFVFLYRDPRETVSSMLDAWRSEKFVTYRDLPGWDGPPWSLLLTPGWRDLADRPLGDVVSRQWADTVDALLHDLTALDGDRWCVASYDQLVADPLAEIQRLCAFLDIDWDDDLAEPLPNSRHTLDSPHPDKWRRNADELAPFMRDVVAPAATRALDVFAERAAHRSRPHRRRGRSSPCPSSCRRAGRRDDRGGDVGARSTVRAAAVRFPAQRLVPRAAPGGRGVAGRHDLPGRQGRDGPRRRRQPQLALPRPAHADGRGVQRSRPRHRHRSRSWCSRTSPR